MNIQIEHFQLIVNLAPQEVKINSIPFADVFSIDLQDIYYENIYMYFETLNHLFVHRKSENILVVCAAGISRSATLVLAYLLKQKFTLRNAISFLRHKRPQIRPNNGFQLQLIQYEVNLQRNKLDDLDLKYLDYLFSILPEYVSYAERERDNNNKAVILRKNDEWERLYNLGFRKKC